MRGLRQHRSGVAARAARRPAAVLRRVGVRRAAAGGVVALVAVPLVLVLAGARGLPREKVELSGGSAWLASPTQGLLTLIDGASEQIVGSVRVPAARRGDGLSVAQLGSSAYVVNPTLGTVSRVDGGTYEVSAPVQFADGGVGSLLQVYPGAASSYVVDGRRRVASVVDPATLRVRDRLAFPAQPGPGQSVVDEAGRLWVVGRGGLIWFDDAGQHVRPELGDADSRLVLVGGRPVLVDIGRSRVGSLGADGAVWSWSCLQLPAAEQASLLGSASLGRVLAAVPSTGTLVQSGSGNDGCGQTVDIGRPGDAFGPLVESADFLFVPNRTLGRITIVDLAVRQVAADLDLVKPGADLELLAKDGLIFYNDLDSDRAGVIRLDGGQWRTGKALRKYNPARSGEGILKPGGAGAPATPPGRTGAGGSQNQPDQRRPGQDPSRPDPSSPGQDPGRTDPNRPPPGDQPGTGTGPDAGPGTGPGPEAGGPTPTPTPPPTDPGTGPPPPTLLPVIRSLDWTPDPVGRGQPVTFSAVVDNATGATWHWVIVDPATGATLQQAETPDRATFQLEAGSPASLEIRLDVSTEAGAAPTMTRTFATTAGVVPQITELAPDIADPGVGQRVVFHAVESRAGNRASWAWVIDGPTGTNVSPQVAPGVDLTQRFTTPGTYTVTLNVAFDGATDRRSTTVTVTDRSVLTALTGSPVDLRSGAQTVSVRLDNSFVAQTVTVAKASWLSVSDTSIPVQPGGTASVSVSVTGTPPSGGIQTGELTFRLGNSSTVSYDIRVNSPAAPVVLSMNCVDTRKDGIPVFVFNATVSDDDPATLTVVAHVGALNIPLRLTSVNGNQGFFSADRPQPITAVEWEVEATNSTGQHGGRSDSFPCP